MTVPTAICIASFLVIGCSATRGPAPAPAQAPPEYVLTGGLVKAGYAIADTLVSQSKVPMGSDDTVLVA